jgi:predicted membrane metal-binding protein
MLSSFVVGFLWGVMMGPTFEHSILCWSVFRCLAFVALAMGLVAKMSPKMRRFSPDSKDIAAISLVGLFGIFWALAYSPRAVDSGLDVAQVVYARGCGDQITDLLIEADDHIYTARGHALEGDIVRATNSESAFKQRLITMVSPVAEIGGFCQFVAKVRTQSIALLARYPDDIRVWMSAFIFGEQQQLDRTIVRDFREIGLLHALVLSGGHLSLLMGVIQTTIRVPVHMAYIFRIVSMTFWTRTWLISRLLAFLSLGFFCFLVGMSQSIQRALLSIGVLLLVDTFGFPVKRSSQILSVLAVQAWVFPVNFLSLSMLLSWSGVLILKAFYRSTFRRSWIKILGQACVIQTVFMTMSLLFFGSVGVLSLPANLIALVGFGVVLPLDCIALFLQWVALDQCVIWINRLLLQSIRWLAFVQEDLPISRLIIPKYLGRDTAFGHLIIASFILCLYTLAVRRESASRRALASSP